MIASVVINCSVESDNDDLSVILNQHGLNQNGLNQAGVKRRRRDWWLSYLQRYLALAGSPISSLHSAHRLRHGGSESTRWIIGRIAFVYCEELLALSFRASRSATFSLYSGAAISLVTDF
jgi:hypothetical protein